MQENKAERTPVTKQGVMYFSGGTNLWSAYEKLRQWVYECSQSGSGIIINNIINSGNEIIVSYTYQD